MSHASNGDAIRMHSYSKNRLLYVTTPKVFPESGWPRTWGVHYWFTTDVLLTVPRDHPFNLLSFLFFSLVPFLLFSLNSEQESLLSIRFISNNTRSDSWLISTNNESFPLHTQRNYSDWMTKTEKTSSSGDLSSGQSADICFKSPIFDITIRARLTKRILYEGNTVVWKYWESDSW